MRTPEDIYTEPDPIDPDTLANLGPLSPMAGVWEGKEGVDVHPAAEGTEEDPYIERIELQPIDPQPNGPQLLYGLRYHTWICKPGEIETFHDQVGYWLWEPATQTVLQHTIAIPRGQVLLASGSAARDARQFQVEASLGSPTSGICSAPFLDSAFRTVSFRMRVSIHDDGTWSYEEDTVMQVAGRDALFHHTDRNRLTKLEGPKPNPLWRAVR